MFLAILLYRRWSPISFIYFQFQILIFLSIPSGIWLKNILKLTPLAILHKQMNSRPNRLLRVLRFRSPTFVRFIYRPKKQNINFYCKKANFAEWIILCLIQYCTHLCTVDASHRNRLAIAHCLVCLCSTSINTLSILIFINTKTTEKKKHIFIYLICSISIVYLLVW